MIIRDLKEDGAKSARQSEPFWKAVDVARFLCVSAKWVYKAAAAGTLPTSRFGANLRFEPAAIRAYASRCSRGAKTTGEIIPFNPSG